MFECTVSNITVVLLLFSVTPYHSDVSASFSLESALISENFPLSSVAIFATASSEYRSSVAKVINRANSVYANFLLSPEGLGFSGQVCMKLCSSLFAL